jgi:hypothetical protein
VSAAEVAPKPPGKSRDPALDVLRGWAIVLMIMSHVGSRTKIATLAHFPVWISAAEPFVILSGVVLGLRLGTRPVHEPVRRALRFLRIHSVLMVVVIVVHELTGRLNVPWLRDVGGVLGAAWMIPTLRLQSLDYMNILPLFIVFFALSPLLAAGMARGLTWLCLSASVALYAVTLRSPEWFRFTDPACGPEAFVLPCWQLAFVVGVVTGHHAGRLAEIWKRHGTRLLPAVGIVVSALFVLAELQRTAFARLGGKLPERLEWLFVKQTWAPGRAIYDLGLMLLAYLALRRLAATRRPALEAATSRLELLGRNSLYCFLVHLPFALLASALRMDARAPWLQELAVAGALVAVYTMARHGLLRRYVPT